DRQAAQADEGHLGGREVRDSCHARRDLHSPPGGARELGPGLRAGAPACRRAAAGPAGGISRAGAHDAHETPERVAVERGLRGRRTAKRLTLWRELPGATLDDGSTVEDPWELKEANLVLGLCQTFKCTPSVLDEESAEIMRLVAIRQMGTKQEETPDFGDMEV